MQNNCVVHIFTLKYQLPFFIHLQRLSWYRMSKCSSFGGVKLSTLLTVEVGAGHGLIFAVRVLDIFLFSSVKCWRVWNYQTWSIMKHENNISQSNVKHWNQEKKSRNADYQIVSKYTLKVKLFMMGYTSALRLKSRVE